MPPPLSEALVAVLARDREVGGPERAAIARLASPDDAVAEVQLDPPRGRLAPVIGFAAHGTRHLLEEPALERWLDAVAPAASHWGVKLGAARQLYARGRFEPSQLAAHGVTAGAAALAQALAITGADCFSMVGVELASGAIARHVGYVAVTGAQAAEALATARGVRCDLRRLAPDQAWLHVSWDLATTAGPFKVDAGPRQASGAFELAARLGLDPIALEARLAQLQLGDPSHVGLRVGADVTRALTLYFRVTAS